MDMVTELVDESGPVNWDWDIDNQPTNTMVVQDINWFVADANGDRVINRDDQSPGDELEGYEDWSKLEYTIVGAPTLLGGTRLLESLTQR